MAEATMLSARAARATRKKTIVNGPSSASATLAKKNEPPHRIDSRTRRDHSRARIARWSHGGQLRSIRWPPAIAPCSRRGPAPPALLTLHLHLRPGVPQLDRAVEHQSVRPARQV